MNSSNSFPFKLSENDSMDARNSSVVPAMKGLSSKNFFFEKLKPKIFDSCLFLEIDFSHISFNTSSSQLPQLVL